MKTITLEQAYAILENASAVVIDNVVTYPGLSGLSDEDEDRENGNHVFLDLSWEGEDGTFEVFFRQEDQPEWIKVEGSSLWLNDGEDDVQISILAPQNIESEFDTAK